MNLIAVLMAAVALTALSTQAEDVKLDFSSLEGTNIQAGFSQMTIGNWVAGADRPTNGWNPPRAATGTFGSVTVVLKAPGAGNTGWRDRGAIAGVALSDLLRDLCFSASGLELTLTGLNPGQPYFIKLYGLDNGSNPGVNPKWYYSTTGISEGTNGTLVGTMLSIQGVPSGFVPTPQSGTEPTQCGTGMVETAFSPTSDTIIFYSSVSPVSIINGFELSTASASGVSATDGLYTDRVAVTWQDTTNFTKYVVYRNTIDDSASATAISGDLTTNAFSDTTAVPGDLYYYWVLAYLGAEPAPFSASDLGWRATVGAPPAPTNVNASDGTVADMVSITWSAAPSATWYRVYRNTASNWLAATQISDDIAATTYDDTNITMAARYFYWVQAGNALGSSPFSAPDIGWMPARLVAYYALNELSGTAAVDDSVNLFTGAFSDSPPPTLGVASVNPVFGTAVRFDASRMTLASNTPINRLTNNFTVALWVRPGDVDATEQALISSPQTSAAGWHFGMAAKRLIFTTWTVTDYAPLPQVFTTNDVWTHVAVTMNSQNQVQFYTNGIPFSASIGGSAPANQGTEEKYLATDGGVRTFLGDMDEVRVYEGVLSPEDVAALTVPEPGAALAATMVFALLLGRISTRQPRTCPSRIRLVALTFRYKRMRL